MEQNYRSLITGCMMYGICTLGLSVQDVQAQRGLPPKKSTKSTLVTKYVAHLDFLPAMVKLLKVPAGWDIKVAASGLGKARMLYSIKPGELYVTRRDGGDVLLLKDRNGDHQFEEVRTVAAEFKGVHGITSKNGFMYLLNNTELRRYKMMEDGSLDKTWETLINDLPNGGQHPNRTMAFGPDGMLYISVGSECNDCKESDKELASMLQVDTSTWKRTLFASGLRNTIGFDWHPQTKALWGVDNGGDGKGNKWPPEEMNLIAKDGLYGFPFAYGKNEVDQSREDPAGDTKEEWVKNARPSVMEFPAHMAPIGFQFTGAEDRLPFSGDAIVCWHGSWNRKKAVGYKVQRIHFENGQPVKATDFVTGFLKPGFLMFKRKARFGRPAGVWAANGAVYISDDANGVLYAVTPKTTNQ